VPIVPIVPIPPILLFMPNTPIPPWDLENAFTHE
jgi:hypothetical protein